MVAPRGPQRAPDLFTALETEKSPPPARHSGDDREVEPVDPIDDDGDTHPVALDVPEDHAAAPESSVPAEGAFGGLADVLEPPAQEQPSLTSTGPATEPDAAADWDIEQPRARSWPWGWIVLTLLLAGGLLFVLVSETELFQGDLVAQRQARARAEAKRERQRQARQIEQQMASYGTVELSSEPQGARVWMLKAGPEATFRNLSPSGEVQVLVRAPGHAPRVRTIKGSELIAPVVVDLERLPAGSEAGPVPELEPPDMPRRADGAATLELRSNTPKAQLGLLLGWTPGVSVVDLDVSETHEFLVTKPDHAPVLVRIEPPDWQSTPDGDRLYTEQVVLPAQQGPPADAE